MCKKGDRDNLDDLSNRMPTYGYDKKIERPK